MNKTKIEDIYPMPGYVFARDLTEEEHDACGFGSDECFLFKVIRGSIRIKPANGIYNTDSIWDGAGIVTISTQGDEDGAEGEKEDVLAVCLEKVDRSDPHLYFFLETSDILGVFDMNSPVEGLTLREISDNLVDVTKDDLKKCRQILNEKIEYIIPDKIPGFAGGAKRIKKALNYENVFYVGDVCQLPSQELCKIPNLGEKCINLIQEYLGQHDLCLDSVIPKYQRQINKDRYGRIKYPWFNSVKLNQI